MSYFEEIVILQIHSDAWKYLVSILAKHRRLKWELEERVHQTLL